MSKLINHVLTLKNYLQNLRYCAVMTALPSSGGEGALINYIAHMAIVLSTGTKIRSNMHTGRQMQQEAKLSLG